VIIVGLDNAGKTTILYQLWVYCYLAFHICFEIVFINYEEVIHFQFNTDLRYMLLFVIQFNEWSSSYIANNRQQCRRGKNTWWIGFCLLVLSCCFLTQFFTDPSHSSVQYINIHVGICLYRWQYLSLPGKLYMIYCCSRCENLWQHLIVKYFSEKQMYQLEVIRRDSFCFMNFFLMLIW